MTDVPTTSATLAMALSPIPVAVAQGTTEEEEAIQVDDERDDDPGYDDGSSFQVRPLNRRHHIYRLVLNGELHLAPIGEHPQRVLDLGTGTGIWSMDFADQYPSAEVIGTDLSPIQPRWTPPNCTFEVDDFEEEWVYRRKFDYIHARELGGCIGDANQLFRRAFENLTSGGHFEIQTVYAKFLSYDGTDKQAKDAQFWMENICAGARKFGKPLDSTPEWLEKIKAAGFIDVQQDIRIVCEKFLFTDPTVLIRLKIPIGAWPKDAHLKEIGRYQIVQEKKVIDSYTPGIFCNILGWTQDEIAVLIAKVKKDLETPENHLYLPVYFIWGKKP
ncbi:umta methyltransferase family protein [Grosmannia clavigera kw1407]|uniref:Umta methyltransferase family protein n=1 Tax=Grosmannia clavigera (strain kw1407 / UAMH 11150) TaxID=655863 RepID=F0XQD2_GROCL|nr:umta methyltransferase family protein [Grosmannia clavigera kw1407]EFX00489.1 umta methyltransferase family protein [Grosmannia clavigera kw1407]